MKRLGIVGIIIENRAESAPRVNEILTEYGDMILGRMGLPRKDKRLSIIALIINADNDEFGAMTGKLGNIEGVNVCSALSKEVKKEI